MNNRISRQAANGCVGNANSIILFIRKYMCLKKTLPFYCCDIFVRFYPILIICGKNIPQKIWNKTCTRPNSYLVLCVRTVPCKN